MSASGKPPIRRGIGSARRWLRPHVRPAGGVRFGNLRCLKPVSRDWGLDRGLPIDRYYDESRLTINTCGNVLAATSFLQGITAQELRRAELNHVNLDYQLLVTVHAVKAGGP